MQTQLSDQLAQPVRFRDSLDTLHAQGCRVFVEVGAGAVLTGLASRCLKGRDHVAISLDTPGTHGLRAWWRGLGELAVLGLGSVPIQGARRPSVYNQTAGERRACERGPQPHSFDRGPYAAPLLGFTRARRVLRPTRRSRVLAWGADEHRVCSRL